MKKLILYLTVTAAGLSLGSCRWLDVTPDNAIDSKDLFSTGYGFRNALNGIYVTIGDSKVYGENLSWGFLSAAAQQYLTDDSEQGQATYEAYRNASDLIYNSASTEQIVKDIWETQYSIIANINKLLENIDGIAAGEFAYGDRERELIRAEARALRAMLHFDLLRLFAPAPAANPAGTYIPYRDEFGPSAGRNLSVDEFIECVLEDLNAAEPVLREFDTEFHPEAMYASRMSTPAPEWNARYRFDSKNHIDEMGLFFWYRGWRMNYLAVLGLKARVCLYAGPAYYPNARVAARDLYTIFYEQRQWVGFTTAENITCTTDKRYCKLSDDVLLAAYNKNLPDDFEARLSVSQSQIRMPLANVQTLFASDNTGIYKDYRYEYLLAETNASNRAFYTRKYAASAYPVLEAIENPMIPLLRLSEVCYILAELSARDNRIAEGIAYLETVRKARGAERPLSVSVTTQEQLLDEILLDARKEFIAEGNLFYMYKRLNLAQVPSASAPGALRDMSGGYVLPVPSSESPF